MKKSLYLLLLNLLLLSCHSDNKKATASTNEINKTELDIKNLNKVIVSDLNKNNETENFFELIPEEETSINFINRVNVDEYKNFKSYPQIYNGAGVSVGDINNDGLPDIYLAGNSVKDRLYLNKGNFKFKDITEESGIGKENYGWSFGVNMIDINADGYLDIYVCKAGPYKEEKYLRNRLFINNGDGTFNEEAQKYGLNVLGFSVQSAFFDYDLDGDLDVYIANHPPTEAKKGGAKNLTKLVDEIKKGILRTDEFYENVNGKFVNKTKEANLLNYGYKNSLIVSDINKDGFPDLYVCSDYSQPDLYYLNNGNKTFTNIINENLEHITYNSMGSELSDINNDGYLDIYVTDMAPSDHIKSKVFMASMDTKKFHSFVDHGMHYQYMLNTLQLNNGDNTFREIGQLAGIDKTEWTWASLFLDIDFDGNKDLFITNGIKENTNDNDLNEKLKSRQKELKKPTLSFEEFMEVVPKMITPNQVYKNNGDLTFTNTSSNWIDNNNFNSNGAAYADLDNDGDLDLVLNNMDAVASVYKNKSEERSSGNLIAINLKGPKRNPFALGAKISIPFENKTIYHEHYTSRGYLSSTGYKIIIGLGSEKIIPELIIEWNDGTTSIINDLEVNKEYGISYDKTTKTAIESSVVKNKMIEEIQPGNLNIGFSHKEDKINDFKKQVLLPYSQSQNGPFLAKADVNNDGLIDFYVGGAAGQVGALYIQNKDGKFSISNKTPWEFDKASEDLGVLFFDYDQDGDNDLFVTSGSASFDENDPKYQDRLYENDGNGNFTKSKNIPKNYTSNQKVIANDIDNDGDLDLFIGGRVIPDKYPYSPKSQLLINENGIFKNKTEKFAPDLLKAGLVTDAVFSDYDMDGDEDLIVTAEWSPIKIYENDNGYFNSVSLTSLQDTEGIWFSVEAVDLDNDGDEDYLLGNLGLNSKFKASTKKPFHVFCDDFDNNGTYDVVFSKKYQGELVPMRGRQCSSEQMPFISEKFENYLSFAEASIGDILGEDKLTNALHYQIKNLSSICLINNGDKTFQKIQLPLEAQVAPIMNFTVTDIDDDQKPEVIVIGNLYPTEVETIRYDGSIGTILKFDNNQFEVVKNSESGLIIHGDSKDSDIIKINDQKVLLVTNNDAPLSIYKIN